VTLQYGVSITNFGEYGDPREVARLAQIAEQAGWDGLFIWDHLAFVWGVSSGDPFIVLAAVAMVTTRLKLGTTVTPLPRRRPQVLAQTLTTLDRLSHGRMIFGVGLGGVPKEYTAFGESAEAKRRAAMLDEGLEMLTRLWSGESVTHHGAHYTVEGVTLAPLPVQRPRIPVWVGGASAGALRRAAQWDGWLPVSADETRMTQTPEQLASDLAVIRAHRQTSAPFDIAVAGYSTPADGALVHEYAAAGATWWLESVHGLRGSFEEMLARVEAGPAI
jgi:probable F420-dependent oxidoreductase